MSDFIPESNEYDEPGGVAEEPTGDTDVEGQIEQEAWSGPSQEQWEQMTGFQEQSLPILQALGEILSAPDVDDSQQVPEQPGFAADDYDPYDPAQMASLVQREIAQALQPLQGILGVVATDKGEQLARNELETIRSEVGEFDNDTAFLVASGLIEAGHDPGQALRQAAQYAQSYEQKIRADERAKVEQEFKTLAGAPHETPIGGAAAVGEPPSPTGANRYEVAIRRALANNNPALPAG